VAERVVDVFLSFDTELKKIVAPLGRSTSLPIGMSDALGISDADAAERLQIKYVVYFSPRCHGPEDSGENHGAIKKISRSRARRTAPHGIAVLEEQIQAAVAQGHRPDRGRGLRPARHRRAALESAGTTRQRPGHRPSGQRVGSMGFPNTTIEVMGPGLGRRGLAQRRGRSSWSTAMPANGTANAMAQGKVYVAGNIGARGMTMTKHNPRFAPPELWVLGSVGDYFGEFMAGGIAVICGTRPQTRTTCSATDPFVGMVGGKVFFRGPHQGFSQADARTRSRSTRNGCGWQRTWNYLAGRIKRPESAQAPPDRRQWQLLVARTPQERIWAKASRAMASFHKEVWDQELGHGGLVGDLTDLDRSTIPVITTRRPAPLSCRSGKTASTRPPARPPAPPGFRSSSAGSWSARVGWTRRWTWPWPTPLSGHGLRLPVPQPVHAVVHQAVGGHGAGGHHAIWARPASMPSCPRCRP
jgi:hypothetical protein